MYSMSEWETESQVLPSYQRPVEWSLRQWTHWFAGFWPRLCRHVKVCGIIEKAHIHTCHGFTEEGIINRRLRSGGRKGIGPFQLSSDEQIRARVLV